MSVTDNKAIVVAIDNGSVYRMDELVPDLGNINTEGMDNVNADDLTHKRGSDFADFVCDTVMPYVQKSYNVYDDARHTSLSGSSLGGLETFCTVLSHPDKFGTGGVMSATFDMYSDKEWTEFLSDKYKIVRRFSFPDHHKFSRSDIRSIQAASAANSTAVVVTTEKDAQRVLDCDFMPSELKERMFFIPVQAAFLSELEKAVFTSRLLNLVSSKI